MGLLFDGLEQASTRECDDGGWRFRALRKVTGLDNGSGFAAKTEA